jgi:hypothetical protein
MDEEYRPRPDDRLVEPFFAGLEGASRGEETDEGSSQPKRGGCMAALLRLLRSCLGRGRDERDARS